MATDPNQQVKNIELEIQRIEQQRKGMMKRMLASTRSVQALIGEIDAGRDGQNLSSAIRVFVLAAVQVKARS